MKNQHPTTLVQNPPHGILELPEKLHIDQDNTIRFGEANKVPGSDGAYRLAPHTLFIGALTDSSRKHNDTQMREVKYVYNHVEPLGVVTSRVLEVLDSGVMPGVDNGWVFEEDTRPAGNEDGDIPSSEYTQYFANGKIPIAAAGHRRREHDAQHVTGYQRLFKSERFSHTVRSAAQNSVGDSGREKQFTGAINGLGDGYNQCFLGRRYQRGDVNVMARGIRLLADLSVSDKTEPDASLDLARSLWSSFGMTYCWREIASLEGIMFDSNQPAAVLSANN